MITSAKFYFLFYSFYFENPMMKFSKMKNEIVLKDQNPKLDSIQIVLGAEQRTSMNSMVVNNAT